jgi:YdjC-like protein
LDKPSGGFEISGAADGMSERRRIWLCADDYGITSAVNVAIRDLVVRRRLNATSVMVVAPGFHRSEAHALDVLNTGMARVAIGLHLTLTAPFRPLSSGYRFAMARSCRSPLPWRAPSCIASVTPRW